MKIYRLFSTTLILTIMTCIVYGKTTNIVWEAETAKIETGNSFRTERYLKDPSGKISGNPDRNVLITRSLSEGRKLEPDAATYKINIPKSGIYYLHVRVLWGDIGPEFRYSNSLGIKISTHKGALRKVSSSTYDTMHWCPMYESVGMIKPLQFKKGEVTITLIALVKNTKVDQLLLTTDKKMKPQGIYKATPGAVHIEPVTTIVWEAETAKIETGKSFRVEKYKKDPSGKISGDQQKNVLAIPILQEDEKLQSDSASYQINIPKDGIYYLHTRVLLAFFYGGSRGLNVKISAYNSARWKVTSSTYDTLHWCPLYESSGVLKPLQLKKGVVTITLVAVESGVKVDQLLLTTDKYFNPTGIFNATPNAVIK